MWLWLAVTQGWLVLECMVCKSDGQVYSHPPMQTAKHYVCVCVVAYIARMRLLEYYIVKINFVVDLYTWPIVMFCLFINVLYEWNGIRMECHHKSLWHCLCTLKCHWQINILVSLNISFLDSFNYTGKFQTVIHNLVKLINNKAL